jgi:hypothetical protein
MNIGAINLKLKEDLNAIGFTRIMLEHSRLLQSGNTASSKDQAICANYKKGWYMIRATAFFPY